MAKAWFGDWTFEGGVLLHNSCPPCPEATTWALAMLNRLEGPRGGRRHGKSGHTGGCRCPTCNGWATQDRDRRLRQRNSALPAENKGKLWTGPELEMVLRTDLTVQQIAERLGRTIYAVKAARHAARNDPKKVTLAGVSLR